MSTKTKEINLNGVITLGSRMKRLSDLLFQQVQEIYDAHSPNFKASWFATLATIQSEESIDFKTLASKHNVSSSAVSQTIKELEKHDLVKVTTGLDKRSRLIMLTKNGEDSITKLKPLLSKIEEVLNEMIGGDVDMIIKFMDELENKLRRKTVRERVEVKIVNYDKEYKNQFKALNLSWLNENFEITTHDEEMLSNP